jgi:hypothetical protein
MQWLIHGSLTQAAADALVRHGHKTHAVGELDLAANAPPADVLAAASVKQWDVITNDAILAATPFDSWAWFKRSIVYLQLAGGEVEQDDAIDRLFTRYKRLTPGRIYTVTASRVKIRQLPREIGNRGSGRSSPGAPPPHTPEPEHPSP